MSYTSFASTLRSLAADTFHRTSSDARKMHDKLCDAYGPPPGGNSVRFTGDLLATRDLAVGNSGGYLVETVIPGVLPALHPYSVAFRFGAERLRVEQGNVHLPLPGDATVTWAAAETTQATSAAVAFTDAVATPKMLIIHQNVSRQLLLQSAADVILPQVFAQKAAAELDRVLIGGSGGSGQPLGIANTVGVNTFTGASLDYAAIIVAQSSVADDNAIVNASALGFATTPTVAALLKARHRVASTDSPLWVGNLSSGTCEGTPAIASKSVPAATAVYGDWSQALVVEWGTPSIEVDPYSSFATGLVGVRLMIPVDIVLRTPKAFALATSVT